jgi:hypothetical protein
MPLLKRTFAHLSIDQPRFKAALPNVKFAAGCNLNVVNLSDGADEFSFTLVVRKETDFPRLLDGKRVIETINKDRFRDVTLHLDGTLELQSTRDMKLIWALVTRCGFSDLEVSGGGRDVHLLKWAKEIMEAHEFVQLGGVQIDGMRVDPTLMGRYTAKTIDNRVVMSFLEENQRNLSSVKLAWFDMGLKQTLTAHQNGTLEATCKDSEELYHLFDLESRRFLACGERS